MGSLASIGVGCEFFRGGGTIIGPSGTLIFVLGPNLKFVDAVCTFGCYFAIWLWSGAAWFDAGGATAMIGIVCDFLCAGGELVVGLTGILRGS